MGSFTSVIRYRMTLPKGVALNVLEFTFHACMLIH